MATVSFDAFVAEHLATLSRYAAALTGDRDRAQDTLVEALIAIERGITPSAARAAISRGLSALCFVD